MAIKMAVHQYMASSCNTSFSLNIDCLRFKADPLEGSLSRYLDCFLSCSAVAVPAANGLRALADQLEKEAKLTALTADRMAVDFLQSR